MNELLRRLLALPPQASSIARSIDTLHYIVISVTVLGATAVAAVALYFVVRYRKRDVGSASLQARPSNQPSPKRVERLLIPLTLLLFIAFWLVGVRQYVALQIAPANAIDIYVTGKQWMWKFGYPEGHDSIDVLTVPLGRPVRLVMTSRDVIHSFYVPAFRVKQDLLPGRYTTLWFEATVPGEYEIACAEYCGVSHSAMAGKVVVLPPDEYARWLAGQEVTVGPTLAERGRLAAVKHQCLACHSLDGRPHIGPTWRGLYGSDRALADGRHVLADEAYLTRSMMRPNEDIVAGYTPVMPTYEGLLPSAEVAALVEYIKALRDVESASSVDAPALLPGSTSVVAPGSLTVTAPASGTPVPHPEVNP